ncbi:hypothetical protein AB0910_14930 [Streptomyces sp. NPDC047002]|uniref:hypothetical protein n=1 Tax=Streptomyces sp. NPDC047002 TaxID=3155475 RepID=UPI0034512639
MDAINGAIMADRIDGALSCMGAAAASLEGWSVAAEIHDLSDSWRPALKGLQERLSAAAEALRGCAASHEWNETLTVRDFEGV